MSAEEELAGGIELPGDHDLWHAWFGDDVSASHAGFLSGWLFLADVGWPSGGLLGRGDGGGGRTLMRPPVPAPSARRAHRRAWLPPARARAGARRPRAPWRPRPSRGS